MFVHTTPQGRWLRTDVVGKLLFPDVSRREAARVYTRRFSAHTRQRTGNCPDLMMVDSVIRKQKQGEVPVRPRENDQR